MKPLRRPSARRPLTRTATLIAHTATQRVFGLGPKLHRLVLITTAVESELVKQGRPAVISLLRSMVMTTLKANGAALDTFDLDSVAASMLEQVTSPVTAKPA